MSNRRSRFINFSKTVKKEMGKIQEEEEQERARQNHKKMKRQQLSDRIFMLFVTVTCVFMIISLSNTLKKLLTMYEKANPNLPIVTEHKGESGVVEGFDDF